MLSVWALLCVTHTNHVLGHWVSPENIHNLVFGTIPLKAGYLRWVWHGYLLKPHIDTLLKSKNTVTCYIFLAWGCWAFIEHWQVILKFIS